MIHNIIKTAILQTHQPCHKIRLLDRYGITHNNLHRFSAVHRQKGILTGVLGQLHIDDALIRSDHAAADNIMGANWHGTVSVRMRIMQTGRLQHGSVYSKAQLTA